MRSTVHVSTNCPSIGTWKIFKKNDLMGIGIAKSKNISINTYVRKGAQAIILIAYILRDQVNQSSM